MVLKTGLGAKPFLPPVPGLTRFSPVLQFFLDRTGGRFPVELVGPAGPIRFLKPWLFYLFLESEVGLCALFLDPWLAFAGRGGGGGVRGRWATPVNW